MRCEPTEKVTNISLEGTLFEELRERQAQIKVRLDNLQTESNNIYATLEEMEERVKNVLSASTSVEITQFGIADHRPPAEQLEADMAKYTDLYLQNFNFYLLNVNLISRLEARQKGIGDALVAFQKTQGNGQLCGKGGQVTSQEGDEDEEIGEELANWYRKKRLGSRQTSITKEPMGGLSQSSPSRRRARLFGGSLEEYVESTGEAIPLVVTSCIRVLSRFALHHQGVFRVSGSQVEINNFREAFEMGEDPLRNVQDGSDVNSIAGVLKLYLRGLRGILNLFASRPSPT